jgi:hypothetical protein
MLFLNILVFYKLNEYKMKTTISRRSLIILIIMMISFSGAFSQSFIPVKGKGPSIEKNFNVSDFKGIDVSGGFDVILVQGSTESLTLTAQENLFEHITANVENGILRIYTHNNLWATQPMKARITFKNINSLKVSGGGDTYSETPVDAEALNVNISGGGDFRSIINSGELKYYIRGGGDTDIEGKTKDYNLDVSGGGDIKSKINSETITCRIVGGGDLYLRNEVQASKADIEINGGGDMDIKLSTEKLRCSVSGGGDAIISGQASEFEVNINGGGDIDAKNLSTAITSFKAGGGSDIRVKVSQELTGYISGGGDVYYSGNPAKVSVEAKGGSKVYKE